MILDSSGQPMKATPVSHPAKARASVGMPTIPPDSSIFPYTASSWQSQEMGDWLPWIRSPDAEINIFRDRMVARSRDLVRNDGWATGGITRILDNTVGAAFRLSSKPDYRALEITTGIKEFDSQWADEFRRAAEALWRGFTENLGRYNDVSRQLTISQQFRLLLRHKLIDGDALALTYWMPDRVGYAGADYATCFLVVDPDRLSNPYQRVDTKYMRGGVEIDEEGVPVAYHIRKAHQNDWYNAIESMEWDRIEREDEDGFRRVIHDYEHDRAGQNRGLGVFTSVLAHMRMLARYYGVELQAATVAAIFGAYVTSPYDPSIIQDTLTGPDVQLDGYQLLRSNWHEERPALLNGVRVPTLAPGEEIKQVAAAHPHGAFEDFAHEMLRTTAAALGVSAEQITQDWSKTNYSSARAALLESWKTLVRRRQEFATGVATPMYATWLAEAVDLGLLPLPKRAPDFNEAGTAYSRCRWLGPGRGWIDPVKERQGSILGMDAGLSTLEQECAENSGLDWEEVLDQREIEVQAFQRRNLALPEWGGREISATDAATPAQQPQAQ
jgi:lambda family phage portal protein